MIERMQRVLTDRGAGLLHNCKVTRVIDADTFKGVVDLDFGVSIAVTVRLFDCDAWEIHGEEKKRGERAKEFVEALIGGNTVQVDPHKQDSFGRWLCEVLIKGRALSSILSERGFLKIKVEKDIGTE
jgi:endonuclease YncB( thermonuclease family)